MVFNPKSAQEEIPWDQRIRHSLDQGESMSTLIAEYKVTPLFQAVVFDDEVVVADILNRGIEVNVNWKDANGVSSLVMSCKNNNLPCIRLLLDAGADTMTRSEDLRVCLGTVRIVEGGGRTPLHWSAANGSLEACKLLIEYGAETCVWDNDGLTPADVARLEGFDAIAELLAVPSASREVTAAAASQTPLSAEERKQRKVALRNQTAERVARVKAAEARRKEREMLATIRREYKPLNASLYNAESDMTAIFDAGFLKVVHELNKDGGVSGVAKCLAPGIFEIKMFNDEFCVRLLEELDHFSHVAEQKGWQVQRPNSMNNYGLVLNKIGFHDLLQKIMTQYFLPIASHFFPEEAKKVTTQHTFLIKYKIGEDEDLKTHRDFSVLTLNLCVGKNFEGGTLYFHGVENGDEEHVDPFEHPHPLNCPRCILRHHHRVGMALFHVGRNIHGAEKILSGERCNLIMWCQEKSAY